MALVPVQVLTHSPCGTSCVAGACIASTSANFRAGSRAPWLMVASPVPNVLKPFCRRLESVPTAGPQSPAAFSTRKPSSTRRPPNLSLQSTGATKLVIAAHLHRDQIGGIEPASKPLAA